MGNPDTPDSLSTTEHQSKPSTDRLTEATSDKTVSDLEESEKTSDSKSSESTDVPSPDGISESERGGGRADGSDTGGPI